MRKRGRVDKNQSQIVAELRRLGMSVTPTSGMGQGFPDLLVGVFGHNFLIELKSTDRKWTTKDEAKWHTAWTGQKAICSNTYEVLNAIQHALSPIAPNRFAYITHRLNEMRTEHGRHSTDS